MIQIIQGFGLIVLCFILFVLLCEICTAIRKRIVYWFVYGTFYRKGVERKYGKAIASYVVDHGYSVRKAQKRVEMDTIERIHKNEDDRRDFTASVDCPRCGVIAVHWLRRRGYTGVTRQCKDCGWEWSQR